MPFGVFYGCGSPFRAIQLQTSQRIHCRAVVCSAGDRAFTCTFQFAEVREQILENRKKYDIALEKLEYKIGRYEIAQKTGKLTWE